MREVRKISVASFAPLAESLCGICHLFGERQWCLATSGNFSARIDSNHFMITQSGKDKSKLTPDDLMICELQGQPEGRGLVPSAETALHLCLYRHNADIGAVFHTHSAAATSLSRCAGSAVTISGYEMQKAFAGIRSHETSISVPVFDNSQDMLALARSLKNYLDNEPSAASGFLIRGHGLYAWGKNVAEAQRHLEALEFLLACMSRDTPALRQ